MSDPDRSRPSLLVVGLLTVVVVVGGMFAKFLFEALEYDTPHPNSALLAANHRITQTEARHISRLRIGGKSGQISTDAFPCQYSGGLPVGNPVLVIRWDPPKSLGRQALDELVAQLKTYGYVYDHSNANAAAYRNGIHTIYLQRQIGHKVVYLSAAQADRGVDVKGMDYDQTVDYPFPTLTAALSVSPSGCDTRSPDR